jgi:hypothetical protein
MPQGGGERLGSVDGELHLPGETNAGIDARFLGQALRTFMCDSSFGHEFDSRQPQFKLAAERAP